MGLGYSGLESANTVDLWRHESDGRAAIVAAERAVRYMNLEHFVAVVVDAVAVAAAAAVHIPDLLVELAAIDFLVVAEGIVGLVARPAGLERAVHIVEAQTEVVSEAVVAGIGSAAVHG